MLSTSKKKVFLVQGEIFYLVDPVQHQDLFSKGLLGEFCQRQPFQVKMYLFFPPKSPTEILKLTSQRRHASELAGVAALFQWSQRRVLLPCLHSTQLSDCIESLNRFREQCLLENLGKCLKIHNCTATRNRYHIFLI